LAGADFKILSIPNKSEIGGAMFLHRAIPELTAEEPDGHVWIEKVGTATGYATKVYGDPEQAVSFTQFKSGPMPMWSLRRAYDDLWDMYRSRIAPFEVHPTSVADVVREFDLVLSTVAAPLLCLRKLEHKFAGARIAIEVKPPITGLTLKQTMIYNGDLDTPWYRYAQLDGIRSWEYGGDYGKVPWTDNGFIPGTKPLHTDCDCHPKLIRAGRFGTWRKGVLTHHAYEVMWYALQ
jgi:hypothetical protein